MIKVLIESPFKSKNRDKEEEKRNVLYARAALRDCLKKDEAPFASHVLYTQEGVLDDDIYEERRMGIEAGLQWGASADKTVVYADLGVSSGMQEGIDRARSEGRPVFYRYLGAPWSDVSAGSQLVHKGRAQEDK